jgi:hypothetical protein
VVVAPVEESDRPVTASARLAGNPGNALVPGAEFDTVVTVTIREGWHINANPTGVPEMKPTTLQIAPASTRSATMVHVTYPAGEAKVLGSLGTEKVALYEGKVQLTARLRLAENPDARSIPLKLKLAYQACNDRLCEAPTTVEIPLDIPVAR